MHIVINLPFVGWTEVTLELVVIELVTDATIDGFGSTRLGE